MRLNLTICFVAGAIAGCDPSNKGPSGPVTLVRIMVQDASPNGVRGAAMDLLDTPGSPYTTAVRCDANNPCQASFLLGGVSPDFTCTPAGTCNDPLAAGLAPLTPPATHRTGEAGGTQLRVVFNKVLSTDTPAEQVLELDDAAGARVAGDTYYDLSGSPTVSADPVRSPYGPALVFKASAPLNANASYTIKINAQLVHDRDGNPMADQQGNVLTAPYTKSFMTEKLILLPQTTPTNIAAGAVSLTPDEILQLGFNAPASANTTCTVTSGAAPVIVKVYRDAGATAANCAAADATLVDVVAVDALGAPVDWAAGSYDVSCDVAAAGSGGGSTTVAGSFTVAGSAKANDPLARTQHVVCP